MFPTSENLESFASITVLLIGILLTASGIHSLIDPGGNSEMTGPSLKAESLPSIVPYDNLVGQHLVAAAGARTLSFGLLFLVLWSQGALTTVGVLCFCLVPVGAVDTAITMESGRRRVACAHAIGTFSIGAFGGYLIDRV